MSLVITIPCPTCAAPSGTACRSKAGTVFGTKSTFHKRRKVNFYKVFAASLPTRKRSKPSDP